MLSAKSVVFVVKLGDTTSLLYRVQDGKCCRVYNPNMTALVKSSTPKIFNTDHVDNIYARADVNVVTIYQNGQQLYRETFTPVVFLSALSPIIFTTPLRLSHFSVLADLQYPDVIICLIYEYARDWENKNYNYLEFIQN